MKKKKDPLIYKFDQFLFKKVDSLQESSIYSNVSDLLGQLDDEVRVVLNQVSAIIFLLLPFFIIIIAYMSNQHIKDEIALKQEIINKSNNSLNISAFSVENSRTSFPASLAERTILIPCSSVPVKKYTSLPRSVSYRARASVCIFSNA